MLLISAAAAAGFIYVRVWRGWNIGDLMYVTKASLQETVGLVTAGDCADSSRAWPRC